MTDKTTTNLDDEKAEPLGDTGDGDTGVPDGEQGISNRAGDKAVDLDEDELDDEDLDDDEDDDEDEDDGDELDEDDSGSPRG